MLQFEIKGIQFNVDETKLTAESIEKALIKAHSRICAERLTGKDSITDTDIQAYADKAAVDPNFIWEKVSRQSAAVSTSALDKELAIILKEVIKAKNKIPAAIVGKTFEDRYKLFIETDDYQEMFEKVKSNQSWIDKANGRIEKKKAEAEKRKAEKAALQGLDI